MKSLNLLTIAAALMLVLGPVPGGAQTAKPEAPEHQELRALREDLLSAINRGDLAAITGFMHPNVVITWHNAEVSRGHAGVRAYFDRVMTGPEKIVEKFSLGVTVDELTIFHPGGTGICFGSSDEHFKLANGSGLDFKGRWTASLIKENGKWLITSLHALTNLFDNLLLDLAKKTAGYVAVGCLVAGAVVGWLVGRRRKASV